MVSGFIEEQEMGPNEEGTGESDAHAPSTTHIFCGFLHHRLGELEAMRNEASFSFELAGSSFSSSSYARLRVASSTESPTDSSSV